MDNELLAKRFFRSTFEKLSEAEKKVIGDVLARRRTARDAARHYEQNLTFGQRVADRVAAFGGSWTFIILFMSILVGWIILNSIILIRLGDTFDPYPYILLNLVLSMLAAFQAPIIMMSQNRQAARDRADQQHDYEVNLKTEMELMQLHDKVDLFMEAEWLRMIQLQQEQVALLRGLSGDPARDRPQQEAGT
ncbi:MAG: DUF1003 domain-containing protein [Rhodospirillales bacterium]|nr:DUF1003 domain-containing protein [Rhodospirillales bacterium]